MGVPKHFGSFNISHWSLPSIGSLLKLSIQTVGVPAVDHLFSMDRHVRGEVSKREFLSTALSKHTQNARLCVTPPFLLEMYL